MLHFFVLQRQVPLLYRGSRRLLWRCLLKETLVLLWNVRFHTFIDACVKNALALHSLAIVHNLDRIVYSRVSQRSTCFCDWQTKWVTLGMIVVVPHPFGKHLPRFYEDATTTPQNGSSLATREAGSREMLAQVGKSTLVSACAHVPTKALGT